MSNTVEQNLTDIANRYAALQQKLHDAMAGEAEGSITWNTYQGIHDNELLPVGARINHARTLFLQNKRDGLDADAVQLASDLDKVASLYTEAFDNGGILPAPAADTTAASCEPVAEQILKPVEKTVPQVQQPVQRERRVRPMDQPPADKPKGWRGVAEQIQTEVRTRKTTK